MTQEDKELLLKDLCARLLYGVKVTTTNPAVEFGVISGISIENKISVRTKHADIIFDCTEVKPYLRPMSSMTEDEKNELKQISNDYLDEWEHTKTSLERWKLDAKESYKRAVFYNSHHLDWNDLISKGLALEAPKDMYKEI